MIYNNTNLNLLYYCIFMESPIRRLYLRAGHQVLLTKNELCAGKHSGLFEHLFNIEGSFIIHYYHVAGCELRIKYKGH